MKYLIILIFSYLSIHAEEIVTLSDGRILRGTVNDSATEISIGKGSMVAHVPFGTGVTIIKREMAQIKAGENGDKAKQPVSKIDTMKQRITYLEGEINKLNAKRDDISNSPVKVPFISTRADGSGGKAAQEKMEKTAEIDRSNLLNKIFTDTNKLESELGKLREAAEQQAETERSALIKENERVERERQENAENLNIEKIAQDEKDAKDRYEVEQHLVIERMASLRIEAEKKRKEDEEERQKDEPRKVIEAKKALSENGEIIAKNKIYMDEELREQEAQRSSKEKELAIINEKQSRDARNRNILFVMAFFVVVSVFFCPSIIAYIRDHRFSFPIISINIAMIIIGIWIGFQRNVTHTHDNESISLGVSDGIVVGILTLAWVAILAWSTWPKQLKGFKTGFKHKSLQGSDV